MSVTASREIAVRRAGLTPTADDASASDEHIVLRAPTARVRRGHEIRLVIQSAEPVRPIDCDERLVELIADAHAARTLMLAWSERSLGQIASAEGRCRTQLSRLIKLSYLAPAIVAMILDRRQPGSLTRRRLMATALPLGWDEQQALLGC